MKKVLILISFLFSLTLHAQLLPGIVASQSISSSSFCADFDTIYNALSAKPGIDTANILNAFVDGRVKSGAWAKLIIFWGFGATENQADSYINWVKPGTFNASDPGSTNPTFTRWQGIAGDASSDYLSSNWTPSTQGGIFTQNSASAGVYVRNALNAGYTFGGYGATSHHIYFTPRAAGSATWRFNDQSNVSTTSATSVGFWIINRTASDSVKVYKNGVLFYKDAQPSTGLPNVPIYLCARNANGTPGSYSAFQMSCVFFGSGLTTADITDITNGWEVVMDYLGTGIIAYEQFMQKNFKLNVLQYLASAA